MLESNLEPLQTMLRQVLDNQVSQSEDLREVRSRLSGMERQIAALRTAAALDAEATIAVREQMGQLSERVERIERKLGLSDA
jgi:hypothetical protein